MGQMGHPGPESRGTRSTTKPIFGTPKMVGP